MSSYSGASSTAALPKIVKFILQLCENVATRGARNLTSATLSTAGRESKSRANVSQAAVRMAVGYLCRISKQYHLDMQPRIKKPGLGIFVDHEIGIIVIL
jgi:hypothetical protein